MRDEQKAAARLLAKQSGNPAPQADEVISDTIKEATAQAKKDRLDRFTKRYKATAPAPRYDAKPNGNEAIRLQLVCDMDAMSQACGTANFDFAEHLTHELTRATCHSSNPSELRVANAGIAALSGIAPNDEIEAMLAAQMVATHQAAMKMMGRAMKEKHLEPAQWQSGFAVKLLRTFAAQMDTLQRYRGKGQQKMTVEHVHVHAGGQAIVGSVNYTGGGGLQQKTEEQPHAKQIGFEQATHAPMPALPCADATKDPVPVASDDKRALPDARRQINRRTKRK